MSNKNRKQKKKKHKLREKSVTLEKVSKIFTVEYNILHEMTDKEKGLTLSYIFDGVCGQTEALIIFTVRL